MAGVEPLVGAGWVLYAAVVGVGIDVDHFCIAWYNTGSPRAIRYVRRNPRAVVFDQGTIFRPDELTKLERLLSHMVIGGLLTGGLRVVAPALATLTAAVLYVHIVADLVADVRERNAADGSL